MPRSIQARLAQSPDVVSERDLTDQRTGKPKRVPKRVQQAITAILDGSAKNATIAAQQAGLSKEHLSRMLNKAHVQVFIADERRKTIAAASLRASARLTELLDAESEHVSADMTKHVLALQGIAPKQQGVQVNVNVRAGFVIDLSEGHAPGAAPAGPIMDGEAAEQPARVAGETE